MLQSSACSAMDKTWFQFQSGLFNLLFFANDRFARRGRNNGAFCDPLAEVVRAPRPHALSEWVTIVERIYYYLCFNRII